MTIPDYGVISQIETDPGKPLRAELVKRMAFNPLAIAGGADGAPRILLPAFERITAGTTIRSRIDESLTVGESMSVQRFFFNFIQTGVVRVSYTMTAQNVNAVGSVRRIRNGAETTLVSNNSSGTYTVDAAVLPGDTIRIMMTTSIIGGGSLSNCRFQTGGENLWPGNSARLENSYA